MHIAYMQKNNLLNTSSDASCEARGLKFGMRLHQNPYLSVAGPTVAQLEVFLRSVCES